MIEKEFNQSGEAIIGVRFEVEPLVGRHISEMIDGGKSGICLNKELDIRMDLTLLSQDRFSASWLLRGLHRVEKTPSELERIFVAEALRLVSEAEQAAEEDRATAAAINRLVECGLIRTETKLSKTTEQLGKQIVELTERVNALTERLVL